MQPQQLAEYYLSFFQNIDSDSDDDDLIRSVSHSIQESPTELKQMITDLRFIGGHATMQFIYDALFEIAKSDDIGKVGINLRGHKKTIFDHVFIAIQNECDRLEASLTRRGMRM